MKNLSKALLICAIISATAAIAQPLSIIRKPDKSYWIQGGVVVTDPQTVQISENLHLWIDWHNEAPGQFSLALTNLDAPSRYFRMVATAPEPPPIRVVMLGDSMVADGFGWGAGMYGFFKPNATVLNYAQAWTSTKVFLQSAEFDKMLLIQPNYVLVQYGYSDGGADPDRHSTPEEFIQNLRTIVQTVRGFNGVPILITLHAARRWDANGNLTPSDHWLNACTKQVATESGSPLIDLYKLTFDLFSKLGPSGCQFMQYDPNHPEDDMHVSQAGSVYVSQLVAKAFPDTLGPYLTGVLDPLQKP